MKKGINKKALILPLFILAILAVNLALVIAADNTIETSAFGQWLIKNLSYFGSTAVEITISLIVSLIIFAGIYDILELVSILQRSWVKLIIALGLGLIVVILKWPISIAGFIMGIGATFGAIGIALEILVCIIIFIGLVFGNTYLAKFAAKRKGQAAEIKAIKSAGEAKAAIRGLREIQDEFKRGE